MVPDLHELMQSPGRQQQLADLLHRKCCCLQSDVVAAAFARNQMHTLLLLSRILSSSIS